MTQDNLALADGGFMPLTNNNEPGLDAVATRSRAMGFTIAGYQLPNPDKILRAAGRSIAVYSDLLKVPIVAGLVRRRKAAVVRLQRGIDAATYIGRGDVLDAVNTMLGQLKVRPLIRQMLNAGLYGYQPVEITWAIRAGQYWPVKVEAKPAAWFFFDQDNLLRFRAAGNPLGELCDPAKFVLVRQDPSYDNPYGEADLSLVFWAVTFMQGSMKWWVKFCEKYGMPFPIGKLPRSAKTEAYDDLADQLENMVEDAVAVIPDDASVTLLERKVGAGDNQYKLLVDECKADINIALLGQNATTEGNRTHASATAGTGVTDDIRDDDADMVCDGFQGIIDRFCWFNFGLLPDETPKYRLFEKDKVDKALAERDEKLKSAGVVFTPAYFQRAYNLQEGDLDHGAMRGPLQKRLPDPTFAEQQPDEIDIDAAVAAYLTKILPGVTVALIKPVIDALRLHSDFESAEAALADIYPTMDDSALRATLTKINFAVDTIGRLMVAEELQDA
jgi:phage gp29-like protein